MCSLALGININAKYLKTKHSKKFMDIKKGERGNSGSFKMKNFMIYTDHLVLLGWLNLKGCNGTGK
jgi:hypothetical protein